MSILPSLMPYNETFLKGSPRCATFIYTITGAVTVSARPLAGATLSLPMFGATSQAVIDAFLGTSSEFTAAQFDATSLGADAMGLIVNMKGQAADLIGVEAYCASESGLETVVQRTCLKSTTLTDSTLVTEAALGAYGNIGIKINWGNTPDFDALTAGYIRFNVYFISA